MARESNVLLRVLLIESDDETSRIFQRVLDESDLVESRLTVVKGLKEGLQLVGSLRFDVAVVDIDHDEGRALASTTQILAHSCYVPIILLARRAGKDLASMAHVMGADDYMAKDNLEPDVVGRILCYAVERHALRRQQAERSSDVDRILNGIPDALLVVDASGRLLSWNHRLEELTARSAQDLGAASWGDLIGAGPFAPQPTPGRTEEAALVRADGDRIPCRWNATALVREGRPSGSILVGHDLRQEREAALAAAEVTRLSEVGRRSTYFQTLAHELANPMTPLRIQMHLFGTDAFGALTDVQRAPFQILGRSVERVYATARDMLSLARWEAGLSRTEPASVDVGALVLDSMAGLTSIANRGGITVESECAPGIHAKVDRQRVTAVIDDLLARALRCTPAGGTVRVTVGRCQDGLELIVEDTGSGLDAAQLRRVFEPFVPLRGADPEALPGTGLGLFNSKNIAEQLGGTIECKSAGRGRGTRMRLTLPVDAAFGLGARTASPASIVLPHGGDSH